jgi:hypothetical protein
MAPCSIDGNSDMYGLGIRIGYYLQWYGVILAPWIAPDEVQGLRFALIWFSSATFLATILQTARNTLSAAEIYILILLTFGQSLYLFPVFIWRILTRNKPRYDPTRFPKAKPPGTWFNIGYSLILSAVLVFQVWLWAFKVPQLEHQKCQEYGFLFYKVRLDMPWFRGFNIAFAILLLVVLVPLLTLEFARHSSKKGNLSRKDGQNQLQVLYHFFNTNLTDRKLARV